MLERKGEVGVEKIEFIEAVELGKISQGDCENRSRGFILVYGFHDCF